MPICSHVLHFDPTLPHLHSQTSHWSLRNWVRRWWREAEGFQGRFAVIFPIDQENVTFVASAPIAELHRHNLPFSPDKPRSVQADLAHADNLQRCLTVFHDFDERLLKVIPLFAIARCSLQWYQAIGESLQHQCVVHSIHAWSRPICACRHLHHCLTVFQKFHEHLLKLIILVLLGGFW
jgi:hypothetical protein